MAFIVSEQPFLSIPYPWQQMPWERLQQQVNQNKPPHAILLAGQQGVGKQHFAQALANFLLCASPQSGLACGQCRQCDLLRSETHPDKKYYSPEEGSKAIKIEQVRELSAFVSKTSQQGGKKVVILGPVEKLNINAANALLKNLEEPAGDTVFILFSHVVSAVMATIRSRCQLLTIPLPDQQQAIAWLQTLNIEEPDAFLELAGGAPLVAQNLAQGEMFEQFETFISTLDQVAADAKNPTPDLTLASHWLSIDIDNITQWWLRIIHGMLSRQAFKVADNGIGQTMNRLMNVSANKQWLFKFSDKLLALRQQNLQGANPNMQLLVEELLLDWHAITR